jgi:hypothetical protein
MSRTVFLSLLSVSAILSLGTAGHDRDWVALAVLAAVIVLAERALLRVRRSQGAEAPVTSERRRSSYWIRHRTRTGPSSARLSSEQTSSHSP